MLTPLRIHHALEQLRVQKSYGGPSHVIIGGSTHTTESLLQMTKPLYPLSPWTSQPSKSMKATVDAHVERMRKAMASAVM